MVIEEGGLIGAFEQSAVSLADQMRNKAAELERRGFGAHVSLLEAYAQTELGDAGNALRALSTPIEEAAQRAKAKGQRQLDMSREEFLQIRQDMDGAIGRTIVAALLPTIEGIVTRDGYSISPFATRIDTAFSGTIYKPYAVDIESERIDMTPVIQNDMTQMGRADRSFASIIRGEVLPQEVKRYLKESRSLSGKTFMQLAIERLDTYEEDAQELLAVDDVLPSSLVNEPDPYTISLEEFVDGLSDAPVEENAEAVVHIQHTSEEHDVFTSTDKDTLAAFIGEKAS